MGYEILKSEKFNEHFGGFPESIRKIILYKIAILKDNPGYSSLRGEKLFKGTKNEIRASRMTSGIRLIWQLKGNIIKLIDIGGHDIYRKYGGKS